MYFYHEQLSSAKSLGFDDLPIDKSLIWTKNNKGLRIGPWGTPAFTAAQFPDVLFCFSVNTTPFAKRF